MSEHSDLLTEAGMVQWEREVRGYNRQQVDEYVAWRSGQMRDLEGRLSQDNAEIERLRRELNEARDASARPAHEEISERVGQARTAPRLETAYQQPVTKISKPAAATMTAARWAAIPISTRTTAASTVTRATSAPAPP